MATSDKRFWFVLNVTLGLLVTSLAAWFLLRSPEESKNADDGRSSVTDHDPAAGSRQIVALNAGDGARPVSYGEPVTAIDSHETWERRGVQPQEWDALPATPGMDMRDTPQQYVLSFSLPGVREQDVHVTFTGRLVIVRATLRDAADIPVGLILRRFQLPTASGGRPDTAVTLFSNGVLCVSVAK